MRRTKEWWARLDSMERYKLFHIERADKHTWTSDYLPDGAVECGFCGTPHQGYGVCPYCRKDKAAILAKANGNG